jgi:hypothetical protein
MISLYEMTAQQRELLEMDIEDEQDGQAMVDLLNELADDIEAKAARVAYVVRQLEAEAEAIRGEERRLRNRREVREHKIERMKEYLLDGMVAAGVRKAGDVNFTVSVRKSPPSLVVHSERAMPERYWIQPPPVLDKKALKQDLKDGRPIAGAELVQREHVRIS